MLQISIRKVRGCWRKRMKAEGASAVLSNLPWSGNFTLHEMIGEGNPSDYFYVVWAVNSGGNSTCAGTQAGEFTRPLAIGPNLISIPLIQSNEFIETVLQTVNYDKAWYYDSLSKQWKWYMKYKEYRKGLYSINHSMGVWINVTENSNLTVAGTVPAQTSIRLHEGWNLVGFPSMNASFTVSDLRAAVPVVRVEAFSQFSPPSFLKVLANSDVLLAGEAYWMRVVADVDWIVEVA